MRACTERQSTVCNLTTVTSTHWRCRLVQRSTALVNSTHALVDTSRCSESYSNLLHLSYTDLISYCGAPIVHSAACVARIITYRFKVFHDDGFVKTCPAMLVDADLVLWPRACVSHGSG